MKNENESLVFARWREKGGRRSRRVNHLGLFTTTTNSTRLGAQRFGRDSFRIKVEGPFRISGYSIPWRYRARGRKEKFHSFPYFIPLSWQIATSFSFILNVNRSKLFPQFLRYFFLFARIYISIINISNIGILNFQIFIKSLE